MVVLLTTTCTHYVQTYDLSSFNEKAVIIAQVLEHIIADGELVAGSPYATAISDIMTDILGGPFMGGVLAVNGGILPEEIGMSPSERDSYRLSKSVRAVIDLIVGSIRRPQAAQTAQAQGVPEFPDLAPAYPIIEEYRKIVEIKASERIFYPAEFDRGLVDGAASLIVGDIRFVDILILELGGFKGIGPKLQVISATATVINEIQGIIEDPGLGAMVELVIENAEATLDTLSDEQISYIKGRIAGRVGTGLILGPYLSIPATVGDAAHGVVKAGATIEDISEWVLLGGDIQEVLNE